MAFINQPQRQAMALQWEETDREVIKAPVIQLGDHRFGEVVR